MSISDCRSTPGREYLNQGHQFVGVVGTLYPVGFLVVPAASPAKTLGDLREKRVGVYGINGTSTAIFGVVAAERFGLDIRRDLKLFGSTPPALPILLDKGEVDATLNLPFFVGQGSRGRDCTRRDGPRRGVGATGGSKAAFHCRSRSARKDSGMQRRLRCPD